MSMKIPNFILSTRCCAKIISRKGELKRINIFPPKFSRPIFSRLETMDAPNRAFANGASHSTWRLGMVQTKIAARQRWNRTKFVAIESTIYLEKACNAIPRRYRFLDVDKTIAIGNAQVRKPWKIFQICLYKRRIFITKHWTNFLMEWMAWGTLMSQRRGYSCLTVLMPRSKKKQNTSNRKNSVPRHKCRRDISRKEVILCIDSFLFTRSSWSRITW